MKSFSSVIYDDGLLFCYDCDIDLRGPCQKHKVKWILSKHADCSFASQKLPYSSKKFAIEYTFIRCQCGLNSYKHIENTLPKCLAMKPSSLYKNEIGVWTLEIIKQGTIFGPFMGNILNSSDSKVDVYECSINGRAWLIHKNKEDGKDIIIDAANPFLSNWMRSVSCSMDCKQQNLLAIQYDGLIFYRACEHEKDIEIAKGNPFKKSNMSSDDATLSLSNFDTSVDIDNTALSSPTCQKTEIMPISLAQKKLLNTSDIAPPRSCSLGTGNVSPAVVKDKNLTITGYVPPKSVSKQLYFFTYIPCKKPKTIDNIAPKPLPSSCSVSLRGSQKVIQTIKYIPKSDVVHSNDSLSSKSLLGKRQSESCMYRAPKAPSLPSSEVQITAKGPSTVRYIFSQPTFVPNVSFSNANRLSFSQSNQKPNKEPIQPSRSILYHKNVEYSSLGSHMIIADIDEQSSLYISRILKFEPYLCIKNIIDCVKEKFPKKSICKQIEVLNLLKSQKIREKSSRWMFVEEDVISSVVDLFRKHSQWTFNMIQFELGKMHPQCLPTSNVAIENIVRSNFSERRVYCVDKKLLQYIDNMAKKRSKITITEINAALRENFPDNKIVSNIVIDEVINGVQKRESSIYSIENNVKKLVQEIYKEWNHQSRFTS